MQAAVEIVAKEGLTNFSMRKVTEKVGVSEALIYKYFGTKDQFLFECYISMHGAIGAMFEDFDMPPIRSRADTEAVCEQLWRKYFAFLIKGRERTIFYFEYRDSPYIERVKQNFEADRRGIFRYFGNLIRGEFPNTEMTYNFVWNLISKGIFGLF